LQELMLGEWRTLAGATRYAPEGFSTAVYQEHVAGKPRLSGASAVLTYFGIPSTSGRAEIYAERKQHIVEQLIDQGAFTAFPDALRLAVALRARGLRLGVASSSKNANRMMSQITVPGAPGRGTLLDLFGANVCGHDLPAGKPHPAIFLIAADALMLPPSACVVVEDAPAGIQAAKAGGMLALGVARLNDIVLLQAAGADLVVDSLDRVSVAVLLAGCLQCTPQTARTSEHS
jgi:beta-phosphoglucomutase-like phosphatase (HAD superfamily)